LTAVRALVTGSDGFVGTWLCAHLEAAGDDVVAVTAHDADITDNEATVSLVADAKPEAIYHLAGLASVGASWENPALTFAVNAAGTQNLLDGARRLATAPTVLLVSSAEVYGVVTPEQLPITEEAPLRPVTPYAASKVAAEFTGLQAHLGYGVPVIRARPFNHVGPGQAAAFVVRDLAQRIAAAERDGVRTLAVGNLTPRRDFTDVRDVVRAYRLLVERGTAGDVYNVCSGRAVGIDELAKRLLELAGDDLELVIDPDLVRAVDLPILLGDNTRLRSATGWQPEIPLYTPLADVLAQARAWLSRRLSAINGRIRYGLCGID
jgi:GDP-4-dehydro-6-deoxy-D-mannose reductase